MADEHPELLHLKDGSGRLPITVAYESGNLQAFVQLIARNSPISDDMGNLIHRSIRDKEKYIFFQAICKNKSYDLNVVEEKTGLTPLMTAVMFNNRTVGLSLMDRHKVNLEVVNPKDNKTALDYAIQFRVKWMLDRFPHPQPNAVAGELKKKRAVLTPEKYYEALVRNEETLVDDDSPYVFVNDIGFQEEPKTWLQRAIALAESATAGILAQKHF